MVSSGNASLSSDTALLTQQYAVCRYVQAIQAGTWVPVKFNGQMFTANLPPETKSSGPTARDWGANSWWQNTVKGDAFSICLLRHLANPGHHHFCAAADLLEHGAGCGL